MSALARAEGKIVALLLYAHSDAHGERPSISTLTDAMYTIAPAMDRAGVLAEGLTGVDLPTFIQQGEWMQRSS